MKVNPVLLMSVSLMLPSIAFADTTIVIPSQNNDQTITTTSETYVQPVAEPYVGAVVPVGGAAAVYGRDVNGVGDANGVGRPGQFNNQFDHKAGAAGYHEHENGGVARGEGGGRR